MWIVWVGMGCSGPTAPVPDPPRHAVLIVVDTLRADIVAEVDTPVLDALSAEGDAVERAWSAGTWTIPSVISMFSGMSVREHGWNLATGNATSYPPVPGVPLLAEVLAEEGFRSDGRYGNDFLTQGLGFSRGFHSWERIPDREMVEQAKEIFSGWNDGRRHFAYLHLIGPHSPLKPSEEKASKYNVDPGFLQDRRGFLVGVCKRDRLPGARTQYRAAYKAVVEDVDAQIGQILDGLGEHRAQTAIVVTSDHGELLGDHGRCGHARGVHEALTQVPLVAVNTPELPDTLGNASVPALLTQALGLAHRWPTPADQSLPLVSQRESALALSPDGRFKGQWTQHGFATHDLHTDPHEAVPLGPTPSMAAARSQWEATTPTGPVLQPNTLLPASTTAKLRALGYAEGEPE